MPVFSEQSRSNLGECDERLQALFNRVIEHFDCAVIEGHRPEKAQNAAYEAGRSRLRWPESKHNSRPARAVDVVPYPVDWEDDRRFHLFAGFVLATAEAMDIPVRWGGDWDQDTHWKDQSFHDLPHFELTDEAG